MEKQPIQFEVPKQSSGISMRKQRERQAMIQKDLELIEEIMVSEDEKAIEKVHRQIDSKYHSCISGWGHSMWGYNSDFGFAYNYLSIDSMKENLESMKAQLESFSVGLNDISMKSTKGIVCEEGYSSMENRLVLKEQSSFDGNKKVFISHSSTDLEYVKRIVQLLETLGLRDDEIVCSSVPPYCIPLNHKVYDWLVEKFQKDQLWVFFVLSRNYYSSAACLNEMGAAWAMKDQCTGILLPGFEFSDIKGCIDSTQISIKLDDTNQETLFYRLEELKDLLINQFELRTLPNASWERIRNQFLDDIKEISKKTQEGTKTDKDAAVLSKDAEIILAYAAHQEKGTIIATTYLNGSSIEIGDISLLRENTPREVAHWKGVIEELLSYRLVNKEENGDELFSVTKLGYEKSDEIVKIYNIDFSQSIWNYID